MRAWLTAMVLSVLAVLIGGAVPCSADSQDGRIRAKVGILVQSGDRVKRAKSIDRLQSGDLLRIYVHPESRCYIYVIHTDKQTVTLLNLVEQRIQSSTLVLPSIQEFYQVDGKSATEAFTIICSPGELKELSALTDSKVSFEKWAALEKDLMERSRIDLDQAGDEKPFAIAGNVRGGAGSDRFLDKLPIFSGKSLLVKRYEFQVAK
ncbi:MAG: hypothetical protein JW821_08945 [Deltaproteobacteria bacterium]|nr:hypothetical protein [Deltaproteobacteria bacterium]